MKVLVFIVSISFPNYAAFAAPPLKPAADKMVVVVYKSPTCSCCTKWEEHLKKNGFKVNSHPTEDMLAIKDKYHVPNEDRSCHTAIIGKYVVEGHVPAEAIKRLIYENPKDIVGIAVPEMPMGTPGMEGDRIDHYNIVIFDAKGVSTVFEKH